VEARDQRGMDEIRSTIFSAGLRRLLSEALQPGERVLWQGQPDGIARMMMWRFLWWAGFPWLLLTVDAFCRHGLHWPLRVPLRS